MDLNIQLRNRESFKSRWLNWLIKYWMDILSLHRVRTRKMFSRTVSISTSTSFPLRAWTIWPKFSKKRSCLPTISAFKTAQNPFLKAERTITWCSLWKYASQSSRRLCQASIWNLQFFRTKTLRKFKLEFRKLFLRRRIRLWKTLKSGSKVRIRLRKRSRTFTASLSCQSCTSSAVI